MNAVIALCHFCENHGPAVVICTQPYSDKFASEQSIVPVFEKSSLKEIKTYINVNKLFDMYDTANQKSSLSDMPRQSCCPGCTSIGKGDCPIISSDHHAKITYMSSQSPEDFSLSTLLRHACVRSLTCEEISSGKDGAMFFGDEMSGQVLSYRFKLQNARARGLQGTYSIIVLSRDRLALLNLWPTLVPNIKIMVTRLQEMAQIVYAEEQVVENIQELRLHGSNSDLYRATSCRGLTIAGAIEPRSLASITRQDKIFHQIHSWFTWLLRVGGQTFTDWTPRVNDGGEYISVLVGHDREKPTRDLVDLYKLLGKDQFATLAFHAVVGNQIIVRSNCVEFSVAIMDAISILLPRACVSKGYSDSTYLQLFQYNLLGLDSSVPLPPEVTSVDAAPCVVMLVNRNTTSTTTTSTSEQEQNGNRNVVEELSPENVTIRMESSKPPVGYSSLDTPCPMLNNPRIVDQYLNFIDNPLNLSSRMVLTNLEIVRNEWLNKTQLYFAFKRKQTINRLTDADCEQRLNVFLTAIGIGTAADNAVVRFWVRGLSEDSKKNITSSMQAT